MALALPSFAAEETPAGAAKGGAETESKTALEANKTSTDGAAGAAKGGAETGNQTALETNKNSTDGAAQTAKSGAETGNQTALETTKNSTDGAAGAAKGGAETGSQTALEANKTSTDGAAQTAKSGAETEHQTAAEANKNSTDGAAGAAKSGARPEYGESIPWARSEEFDPTVLLRKEDYWPDRLSVHYQFSFGMMASSTGASRGGGLYLGIIRYDLAPNLIFSSAVGFSTTFWATSDKNHPDGFRNEDTMKPEFRLPYAALDYYPADNMHLRVQIGDGSGCGAGILRRRSCDAWGY